MDEAVEARRQLLRYAIGDIIVMDSDSYTQRYLFADVEICKLAAELARLHLWLHTTI